MATKFNFNSQVCTTRDQSERILSLGLKRETADCALLPLTDKVTSVLVKPSTNDIKNTIPAWSLNRLIEMMPLDVVPEGGFDNIFTLAKGYPSGYSVEYDGFSYYHKKNIYGTLIEGIEDLIKEGYFNKKYLVKKHRKGLQVSGRSE